MTQPIQELRTNQEKYLSDMTSTCHECLTKIHLEFKSIRSLIANMPQNRIAVDTHELQIMLSCGKRTAVQIGCAAGAKIKVGKRVLWNIKRIQEYLDSLSGGDLDE